MTLRYVGRIVRTLPANGKVIIGDCISRFQGFAEGTRLFVGYSVNFAKLFIVSASAAHGSGQYAVSLKEATTLSASQSLTDMGVFMEESELRAQTDIAYFDDEIVGLTAIDYQTGEKIGTIAEIWDTPAHEIWVIEHEGKQSPVPAVAEFIKNVDIPNNMVAIYCIPGLLNLEDADTSEE
jgi:16S rRNA processing protein RimM